ncbi:MAG: CoA-binding protein, partial [Candidatus Thorarchaeota archaeon]
MNQIDFFEKLFYPKTLAFIGANPRRIWHLEGYVNRFPKDSLYVVSDYYDELMEKHVEYLKGVNVYADISEIPDEIDHSLISVNRNKLIKTIKTCLEKKFYTIHIFSAGTGEFDEKGVEIEAELYELFKYNENSRLVGPNCMGIYSPRGKFSYSGQFSEQAGNFALVSQSGDLTNRIVNSLNNRGVYFSYAASVGNSISLR